MALWFTRMNDVINANINNMIDKLEDPERMIRLIITEMEENILRAREGVLDAISSEKRLAYELKIHKRDSEKWKNKAKKALVMKNERLAREALIRKQEFERIIRNLQDSYETARKTAEQLKKRLHSLEDKLREANIKRSTLAARQKVAQARQQVGRTVDYFQKGLDTTNKFNRMEEKVLEIELRAEAIEHLDNDACDLEAEFETLEMEQEVNEELSALRKAIEEG